MLTAKEPPKFEEKKSVYEKTMLSPVPIRQELRSIYRRPDMQRDEFIEKNYDTLFEHYMLYYADEYNPDHTDQYYRMHKIEDMMNEWLTEMYHSYFNGEDYFMCCNRNK